MSDERPEGLSEWDFPRPAGLSTDMLLDFWRAANGPASTLTMPLIAFAGLVQREQAAAQFTEQSTALARLREHRERRDAAVTRKHVNQRTEIRRLLAHSRSLALHGYEAWKGVNAYWQVITEREAEVARLREIIRVAGLDADMPIFPAISSPSASENTVL